MSLLKRKLLSLACAALLLSAAFTYFNSNESKRKCFTHWEGDLSAGFGRRRGSNPVCFSVFTRNDTHLLNIKIVLAYDTYPWTYFSNNSTGMFIKGDFSGIGVSSIPLNFNVTGSRITSVIIPDGCPFWPEYSFVRITILARITVCNEDGFILDVTLPKKGDLQRVDVRCYVKILGVSIPCILKEFNMEVHLSEYCEQISQDILDDPEEFNPGSVREGF